MKKQMDERIVHTKQKIASRGYYLFLWGLLIILLYRQFYLGQSFHEYGDIFAVWMIGCIYVTFAGSLSGLNMFSERRPGFLVITTVISFSVLGTMIYLGRVQNFLDGLIGFATAFTGAAIMFFIINRLYRYWEKVNIPKG